MEIEEGYTVIVKNAHKKYHRSSPVLCGLNMKVPSGHMYGLLGPSGCGKTTLLKCILGKADIDSGIIQISVSKWKQIGYMPQDVSLHTELNARESFTYYGTIYGIFGDKLHKRINEIAELLELPSLDKIVGQCSGGQKRRISLAITLLHNPDFLLLDEPTVGLDPLLSNKIWNYLTTLSQAQNKTIIITTHYMEEARSLHLVGLMREGVLLAEESPELLINRYECDSLDEVFVKVIHSGKPNKKKIEFALEANKSTPTIYNDEKFSWSRLGAQLFKNHKWTMRNLGVTLFAVFLPVTMLSLAIYGFGLYSWTRGIGYFNEEVVSGSNCSARNTVLFDDCPPSNFFSCQYVDIIRNKLLVKEYHSLEEGIQGIQRGETYGFLYFPNNFSTSLAHRFNFTADEYDFEEKQIQVWMDNTIFQLAFMTRVDIYKTLLDVMETKCRECGVDPRLAQSTISIRLQPMIYGHEHTHLSSIVPGLILSFMFYMPYVYTAALLAREKSCGVIERDQMNGLTTAEILSGNLINQFLIMTLQTLAVMIAVYGVLKEVCLGSYFLTYIILTLTEMHGSLIGLLVTLFTCKTFSVNYLGVGIVFMALFTNGTAWPVSGMHWLLKRISDYNPLTSLTVSYGHVTTHGFSLTHHLVYPGVIFMIFANIIIIFILFLRIRHNKYQL